MSSFDPPLAGADDLRIPDCVATADEAIRILTQHHAQWLER
jgi:hypothetical protein